MKNINEKIKKFKNSKWDKHEESHIQVQHSLIEKAKNVINLFLIITFNVNGINAAINGADIVKWIKRARPNFPRDTPQFQSYK